MQANIKQFNQYDDSDDCEMIEPSPPPIQPIQSNTPITSDDRNESVNFDFVNTKIKQNLHKSALCRLSSTSSTSSKYKQSVMEEMKNDLNIDAKNIEDDVQIINNNDIFTDAQSKINQLLTYVQKWKQHDLKKKHPSTDYDNIDKEMLKNSSWYAISAQLKAIPFKDIEGNVEQLQELFYKLFKILTICSVIGQYRDFELQRAITSSSSSKYNSIKSNVNSTTFDREVQKMDDTLYKLKCAVINKINSIKQKENENKLKLQQIDVLRKDCSKMSFSDFYRKYQWFFEGNDWYF